MGDFEGEDFEGEEFEREEFGTLELWCSRCGGLTGEGKVRGRVLLELLQKAGGTFLGILPGQDQAPSWEINPHPEEKVGPAGGFSVLDFGHPLLARSLLEPVALRPFHPSCAVSFDPDGATVIFSQSADKDEPENLDALAAGQLALAEILYPFLRPELAFIDENSSCLDERKILHLPLQENLAHHEIPYVFWGNLLGPELSKKYGRDTLMNSPCWKKQKLANEGILFVTTQSYFQWWNRPPAEVEMYFAEKTSRHVYNTDWLLAGGPEEVPFLLPPS